MVNIGPEAILEILDSGWPVFTLLGKIERLVIDHYSNVTGFIDEFDIWKAWKPDIDRLDALVEGFGHVPLDEAFDLLVRVKRKEPAEFGHERFVWAVSAAASHLALAETLR